MTNAAPPACAEDGCDGHIADDGWCDTCGAKAGASGPSAAGSQPSAPVAGTPCGEAGCAGSIGPDGYCNTCGVKAAAPAAPTSSGADRGSTLTPSLRTGVFTSGSAHGSRRVRRDSTRTSARSSRSGIGRGLVQVAPAPSVDPASVVMDKAEVAEHKRFCSNCGDPVGRAKGSRKGRLSGFCANCRTPYDFVPKLGKGDLVGGQYEVVGALAHGGLGWIHLAQDTAVSGRWVVLKGLLNAGDEAAMAAAVAERRFLAEVQHPQIVEIYNFATHEGAGYTVMEYVGGRSLKQVLKERKKAADGTSDPLPVVEAISYVLAVLPAFRYLHGKGLVYCDFKPDNVIQVGDDVKLIDLGGVRRVDDTAGDIYGTVGFQAPEVPTEGVSFSSDLYTIGRTLAVLTLDFRGYTSVYVDTLPDPVEHPALRDNESFLRFLRKACAPHPDDRFQTADEFEEQLLGVLRILVAQQTGTPQPGPSSEFTGAPAADELLPWLAVDPSDTSAAFLQRLPDSAAESLAVIDQARADGQLEDTVGVRLRRASDHVELRQFDEAASITADVLDDDPWEWRAVWVQGFQALAQGQHDKARDAFDRCLSEVPGELAPVFAAAVAAEAARDFGTAARLYDLVTTVDPSWTKAAEGLARVRLASGDIDGALGAWDRVPATHRARHRTQVTAARTLLESGRVVEADQVVRRLGLGASDLVEFEVDLLDQSLHGVLAGQIAPGAGQVAGVALEERALRERLEERLRDLARVTSDPVRRIELVDRANVVRPVTLL